MVIPLPIENSEEPLFKIWTGFFLKKAKRIALYQVRTNNLNFNKQITYLNQNYTFRIETMHVPS